VTNRTQESIIVRNNNVVAGIDKRITANVTVGGVVYTPAQLKAAFQGQTTALQTSEAARKQWESDVVAAKAVSKTVNALYASFHSYLVGQYGKTAVAVLADFGMSAPKTTVPTVATKAVAVVKRTATRKARNTMGAVQKKEVKGDVTGVVMTPITSAPTSNVTAPSSPSASATSGGTTAATAATPAPANPTTSGTTPVTTTHSP
jgi:hypothetical protein